MCTRTIRNRFCYSLVAISCVSVFACWRPPGFGLGGRYLDGKAEVTKAHGGDIDKGIALLESVAKEKPPYQDSLTLLGRAYYKKGRYQDALQTLRRAVGVNKEDEIAWICLGLAFLRLGDDQIGLESLKVGLTLLSRVSKHGYKGLDPWDLRGSVQSALRRTISLASKGLEEKKNLIAETETLLQRIDDEEWRGKWEQRWEQQSS